MHASCLPPQGPTKDQGWQQGTCHSSQGHLVKEDASSVGYVKETASLLPFFSVSKAAEGQIVSEEATREVCPSWL